MHTAAAISEVNASLPPRSGDEPTAQCSQAADWIQEATEAAEAWCQISDEEGRNHAIYCYRAGYLKAKRQNNQDQRRPVRCIVTSPA